MDRDTDPVDRSQLLEAVIDLAVDGIVTIDAGGTILSFNRSAEGIFGRSAAEVVGDRVEILMGEPHRSEHESYLRRYLETGERKIIGIGREVEGLRADGTAFPLYLGVSEVPGPGRRVFVAIVRDLTEVRAAQQEAARAQRELLDKQAELIQAEKLSSVGLLAAGVAHEVKNPLMGAMTCIQALEEGTLTDDRRAVYFETARESLERIRITVEGLLDFSRQEETRPERLEVRELVEASRRLLGPVARSLDVSVEASIGDEAVRADRQQLMHALVNVILNAYQAVEAGGTVAIDARAAEDRVEIRVTDDGPGIPADALERVCEPFFTTKAVGEGTGLGLAIVHGIVHSNGGDLEIESEPGAGTTVTIRLPVAG